MYILGYIYYLNQTLTGGLAYPKSGHVRAESWSQDEGGPGIVARIGAALRRAWTVARRRQIRGSIVRTLQRMPDWTLRDIGIHRGEISEVAERLVAEDEAKAARPANRNHTPATRNHAGHLKLAGCG